MAVSKSSIATADRSGASQPIIPSPICVVEKVIPGLCRDICTGKIKSPASGNGVGKPGSLRNGRGVRDPGDEDRKRGNATGEVHHGVPLRIASDKFIADIEC